MKIFRAFASYRSIAHFHENETLIARLQASAAIRWLTPCRRRTLLVAGACCVAVVETMSRHAPWRDYRDLAAWSVPAIALPIVLALVYLLYLMTVHFKRLPRLIRARPQVCIHLLFWLLLFWIWLDPLPSSFGFAVVSLIAALLPYLIWRCGYMVLSGQRGKAAGTMFSDHFFYIFPIWDGTNTPPGKGHENLSRAEAQSPAAYSRSVLAGVKLLLLVVLWKGLMQVMGALVYGDPRNPLTGMVGGFHLDIPRLRNIVNGSVTPSLGIVWLSLYLDLVWETLSLAARGHVWIGLLRLFGFQVFRNTYKPLLAESIVEFWNRYYYYFKELLMEFFFLPTYVRYFRQQPTWRIIFAVFAAAFFGNMYYHVLVAEKPLIQGDAERLWSLLGPRLVYCFLLAAGIAFSMLRQQRLRGQPGSLGRPQGGMYRLRRLAGVWTFFALINFWNVTAPTSILDRGRLFLSVFGF
jgi:hypothetical protein